MYHYIYRIDFLHPKHIGRYYIGKRTVSYKPENDNAYKGSGRFCKAFFDKYGTVGTYRKTILEINLSKEENAEREAYWIGDLWKTDSLCMNQEPGGLKGGKRQGHNHNGEHNPFYGRQHTEESKTQISKARLGSTWHKEYNIGCYSLDGELIKTYTTRDDLKYDGFNPKAVDNVLAGRSKTHKNKYFKIQLN
mgnify:CR=1 FL=1